MDKILPTYYYLYLQKKLLENSTDGKISIQKVKQIFGSAYKIPKDITKIILWEMEKQGLIKPIGRGKGEIEIITKQSHLYTNRGKFGMLLGLY